MKATCIEFSATRAVVRMTPSWIARLFGATTKDIELGRVKQPGSEPGMCRYTPWVCPGSGRSLDDLYDSDIIYNALDFRDVADVPSAVAKIKPIR